MIITVTPNPAIDVTLTLDRLEPGQTHRVPPGIRRAGGKGINVARVLKTMGADAVAIAPVGTLDREWFAGNLGAVPSALLDVPGSVRQSTALVEPHRTTIFNETGSNLGAWVWPALVESVEAQLADADCLVISGSIPPGCPPSLYGSLVAVGRARGIPVIADATGDALRSAAKAGATVLKPNASELVDTTGESDPIAGARELQALGAGLILVSLGENGMIAVPRDATQPVLHARLDRVFAGNPTGAGDAAVAGVASVIAKSRIPVADGVSPTDHEHDSDSFDGHSSDVHSSDSHDLDTRAILLRATAWSAAAVLEPLAGSIDPARVAGIEAELHVAALPSVTPAPSIPAERKS